MTPATRMSIAVLAVLALQLSFVAGERNPCHYNRRVQGMEVPCQVLTLPPALCRLCRLRPYLQGGNFRDCQNIYNLDDAACRAELRSYANLNKCDARRNRQVLNFESFDNRVALDYFVYSVCEECCDCIPRGANPGEFFQRRAAGTLLKVDRANCPTHAHFDVCKVWPNVRYIKTPWMTTPPNVNSEYPLICPIIKSWKESPDGQNLYNKNQVNIPFSMRKFLTQYVKVAQCSEESLWNMCIGLENAQGRV